MATHSMHHRTCHGQLTMTAGWIEASKEGHINPDIPRTDAPGILTLLCGCDMLHMLFLRISCQCFVLIPPMSW
jgi:hypothetical protein